MEGGVGSPLRRHISATGARVAPARSSVAGSVSEGDTRAQPVDWRPIQKSGGLCAACPASPEDSGQYHGRRVTGRGAPTGGPTWSGTSSLNRWDDLGVSWVGTGDGPARDSPSVDDHPIGGLPSEAYGRVTDAGRYSVLHEAARGLLAQLSRDHAVEVVTGPTVDEDLAGRAETKATVRLQPSSGAGAPITIAFTTFPGLLVRLGKWQVEAYLSCACDACDERPEDLIERLRDRSTSCFSTKASRRPSPTAGAGPVSRWKLVGSEPKTTLPREDGRQLGEPDVVIWPPWTAHPSG